MTCDLKQLIKSTDNELLSGEQWRQWSNCFQKFKEYVSLEDHSQEEFLNVFIRYTDSNKVFGDLKSRKALKQDYETHKNLYNIKCKGLLVTYCKKEII